jgi:hypothetical protein
MIWTNRPVDQATEFAASKSFSSSSVGSVALTAGLKKVAAPVSRKIMAYICQRFVVSNSDRTSTARITSDPISTSLRGNRSMITPATGASSTTGSTSKKTAPETAKLEPVL